MPCKDSRTCQLPAGKQKGTAQPQAIRASLSYEGSFKIMEDPPHHRNSHRARPFRP